MRLNVRKRNGVWAVACDDAVLTWYPDDEYLYPWLNAREYVDFILSSTDQQIAIQFQLGLR